MKLEKLKAIDIKKVLITLVSVIFMGISLSVLNIIDCGIDPFTYMNVSISAKIGWSLGNWQILLNVLMFIPVIIWGRKQIGIGTVFNMVLVGYTVDFCMWIWSRIGLARYLEHTAVNIVVMILMVALFIISAATYMATNLGTAPFDALSMMISEKLPKVSFTIVRFLWDSITVAIGYIFSGKIGIVTILMVLFLGKTVEFIREKMFKTE